MRSLVCRLALALAVLPLVLPGCGRSKETPPPQSPQAQPYGQPYVYPYAQQGYGARPGQDPSGQAPTAGAQPFGQQAAAQQPGQMAPIGAVVADPTVMQTILAGALAGGAAALGGLMGSEQAPIEQGIKSQAQTQAKGMRPDGELMSGRLGPDGHAEGSLTMQPGVCYTIIGFGGLGVFDYQIDIMTAPPVPPQILAQSATGSVTPVVGPNEQCARSPFPLPLVVKVDMHVLRGQGLVGAQVYEK